MVLISLMKSFIISNIEPVQSRAINILIGSLKSYPLLFSFYLFDIFYVLFDYCGLEDFIED
jgi:hypothetical protein